jgi:hypothetical protein
VPERSAEEQQGEGSDEEGDNDDGDEGVAEEGVFIREALVLWRSERQRRPNPRYFEIP